MLCTSFGAPSQRILRDNSSLRPCQSGTSLWGSSCETTWVILRTSLYMDQQSVESWVVSQLRQPVAFPDLATICWSPFDFRHFRASEEVKCFLWFPSGSSKHPCGPVVFVSSHPQALHLHMSPPRSHRQLSKNPPRCLWPLSSYFLKAYVSKCILLEEKRFIGCGCLAIFGPSLVPFCW